MLDGLVSEDLRFQLLEHLTGDGNFNAASDHLPSDKWARDVCDTPPDQPAASPSDIIASHRKTFGPAPSLLRALEGGTVPASVELQRRVCALFPEHHIFFQPSDMIEAWPETEEENEGLETGPEALGKEEKGPSDGSDPGDGEGARCTAVLANAAVRGDSYSYHVDADPASFPESEFTDSYGTHISQGDSVAYKIQACYE